MNRQPPADYDAWYETTRGTWIGAAEAEAILRLGGISTDTYFLDAGAGPAGSAAASRPRVHTSSAWTATRARARRRAGSASLRRVYGGQDFVI